MTPRRAVALFRSASKPEACIVGGRVRQRAARPMCSSESNMLDWRNPKQAGVKNSYKAAECVDTDACDTCAVVGSSDRLRLHGKHGALIDGDQCVFRVNHAPTSGYEDYVGSSVACVPPEAVKGPFS